MSGTYLKKVPLPHHCQTPLFPKDDGASTGSLWKCDVCKKVYKLVNNPNGMWEVQDEDIIPDDSRKSSVRPRKR